ncbi:hypothetical protein Tco_0122393 [Tanacetum coccineum]
MVDRLKLDEDLMGDLQLTKLDLDELLASLMLFGIQRQRPMSLTAYADADQAGFKIQEEVRRKCSVFLGDSLVSWSSKEAMKPRQYQLQKAEYIRHIGMLCLTILWMRSQLKDYGFDFNKIPLYCDNKSAIALCCNNTSSPKQYQENGSTSLLPCRRGMKSLTPETLKRLQEGEDE